MHSMCRRLAFTVMALLFSTSACAGLIGATAQGVLRFADSAQSNWFDPALGQVPADASALQPRARISDIDDPYVEFTYRDTEHEIQLDLDDRSIRLSQTPANAPTLPSAWEIIVSIVSGHSERIVGFDIIGSEFEDTLRVVLEDNELRFVFDGNLILESPGASVNVALHTAPMPLGLPSSLSLIGLAVGVLGATTFRRKLLH